MSLAKSTIGSKSETSLRIEISSAEATRDCPSSAIVGVPFPLAVPFVAVPFWPACERCARECARVPLLRSFLVLFFPLCFSFGFVPAARHGPRLCSQSGGEVCRKGTQSRSLPRGLRHALVFSYSFLCFFFHEHQKGTARPFSPPLARYQAFLQRGSSGGTRIVRPLQTRLMPSRHGAGSLSVAAGPFSFFLFAWLLPSASRLFSPSLFCVCVCVIAGFSHL
ncbi:hypothetical protein [Pandoravirus japonicus]|uniref:Transmembrane protein n=1 Tax=Pandoravirus japonicus TaxID=2823154 RepID=A0A811BRF5_9VIRU|nr:hypothetical protein [Pandoravirus japonicus]